MADKKPTVHEALKMLRSVSPEHGEAMARHIYTDKLVPEIGNKFSYEDHLSRNRDKGYHILTDMNNFSEINKLHGNEVGDSAIKRFGQIASETSRSLGLKAHRIGGDEFAFHSDSPEKAQAFAHELQRKLTKEPKIGGTHNLAASIGVGMGKDQGEKSLIEAKKKLGVYDEATGKRKDYHTPGNAPSVVHFGFKNKAEVEPDPAVPMDLSNPLTKNMAIISDSAPNYPAIKSLKQTLHEFNIPFVNLEDHYGEAKPAVLIGPVDENLAKALAEDSGQESLIYLKSPSDIKLMYVNGPLAGSFHKADAINTFEKRPECGYYYMSKSETIFNFWFNSNVISDSKSI
jgi:diguanylate cyclase (GGDEF)-like protein